MNCPSCNQLLLFGSTTCDCGYRLSQVAISPSDLSYREALWAYWRIYWPVQLFGLAGLLPVTARIGSRTYQMQLADPGLRQVLIAAGLGAIALFLFVHRTVSRSYRSFAITVVPNLAGQPAHKLKPHQRLNVWFFLWWRGIVAGVLVYFLAGPLNVLISLIGLRSVFGFNPAFLVSILATVLAVGPVLLKMLVAHPFPDFRLEVKRT